MRSSGAFADVSNWCDTRGLQGATLGRCKQLLSRVPTELQGINKGLATLQFQSLSVSPFNSNVLQGGTQDNGTWQSTGSPVRWVNTMIGDGGQSGFDAANPDFRFHTFFDATPDVNFSGGDMADWNWIGSPIYGTGGLFYVPIIADPVVSRTMFVGAANAWRRKTWGMGSLSVASSASSATRGSATSPGRAVTGSRSRHRRSLRTCAATGPAEQWRPSSARRPTRLPDGPQP